MQLSSKEKTLHRGVSKELDMKTEQLNNNNNSHKIDRRAKQKFLQRHTTSILKDDLHH